ncbi:hypothetical protein EDD86DRAFT_65133 [Gorgonomyces haynaldii]|nr:hypothetical protein EDD86DRAFT_65133 [Gorgonomyces haynaldii]
MIEPTTFGLLATLWLTIPGFFLNTLLVVSILRKRQLRTVPNAFFVHMGIIDACLSLIFTVYAVLQLSGYSLQEYWSCQVAGILVQVTSGMAMINVLGLALFHYQVICQGKPPWTARWWILFFASQWLQAFVMSSIPFWSKGSGYVLHPSGMFCGVNTISDSGFDFAITWIDIFFMFGGPLTLFWLYYRVSEALERISNKLQGYQTKSLSIPQNETLLNARKLLVARAMITSASFILTWFVLGITWTISAVTRSNISQAADMASALTMRANLSVNPIIYLLTDPRFLQSCKRLLGTQTQPHIVLTELSQEGGSREVDIT